MSAPQGQHGRRGRLFRSVDAFAIDAVRAADDLERAGHRGLADELRRAVTRTGGAVVVAAGAGEGGEHEQGHLRRARDGLLESRYHLYLARRLGCLEARRYRRLGARHDAALTEVEGLVRGGRAPPG